MPAANRNFNLPFSGLDGELLYPGAIGRGSKSKRGVRRVQELLCHHGKLRDKGIDEDYGAETYGAMQTFQRDSGLPVTGTLDEPTWEKLVAPIRRAFAPLGAAGTGKTLRETVCLYARQILAENPREYGGANRGFWVRIFMLGNDGKIWLWCAGFVCLVLALACRDLGVLLPIKPSFGATELARSAKARRRFLADGPYEPGDLFVLPDGDKWFHVGIVLELQPPKFLSAEGNTNSAGSNNGDCARSVIRRPERCDYIRIG